LGQWGVEEVFLKRGRGWGGEGLFARRGRDDGDELKVGDGGSRDVDALGIGARVGRGEEEARVVDYVVEEGDVDGGQTFELVFGTVWRSKGEAEPEALGSRTRQECAADEALGVEGVSQVEVADVANVFYVVEEKGDDSAAEIKEVDGFVVDESRDGQVAWKGLSRESAHDDLFSGSGHVLADCRMRRYPDANKVSGE
jgi:hypothetical protein